MHLDQQNQKAVLEDEDNKLYLSLNSPLKFLETYKSKSPSKNNKISANPSNFGTEVISKES